MTPTPRTDAEARLMSLDCDDSCVEIYIKKEQKAVDGDFVLADFARQLERDISTLNDRLTDRQKTLMEQAVKLQQASRILTRCRDSAGRMEMGLYEDIQNFLNA